MTQPITGAAFADARTKDLVKRLLPGQIAVIDHRDLDRVAAETLVESGIAAVINADESSSGRYPNEGPIIVLEAGIALVDRVGAQIMDAVSDGLEVTIDPDGRISADGETIGHGVRQSLESIHEIHEESRKNLGQEFIRFIENTVEYFDHNQDLVSDDLEIPDVGIDFEGRHVLMVVRGHDYREDLTLLRNSGYVAEQRPLLIGVDGGADALLELGMTPDVIVGDFDSVTEQALRSTTCSAVFSWLGAREYSYGELRKLQLAAASGDSLAVLFRPNQAGHNHAPASLRLQMREYRKVHILKQRGGNQSVDVDLSPEEDTPLQPQLWELPVWTGNSQRNSAVEVHSPAAW